MPTLLLSLVGPLQAWGTTSQFDERDSQLEPSKSGVIGLLCAALGRDRSEPVADLAALKMGVRVDREGTLMREFHTATGVMTAAGKADFGRTVVSPRNFLADAAFLVGLEGEDRSLLEQLQSALQAPHWPLCLGRKSYPPSSFVWLKDGLSQEGLWDALCRYPCLVSYPENRRPRQLRWVLEDPGEGALRIDLPIAPFSERRFGIRHVRTGCLQFPQEATDALA